MAQLPKVRPRRVREGIAKEGSHDFDPTAVLSEVAK